MTEVFSWLVQMFGLLNVTMWAISFFSTIPERVLLFFLCSIALGASFFFARFLRSSLMRFLLPVLTSFALFSGLYAAFPMHRKSIFPGEHPVAVVLFLTLIVAVNGWWLRLRGDNEKPKKTGCRITAWFPTVIVVPALAVLLLNGWSLMALAKRLHADKAVRQFASLDFSGIAVDAKLGVLFANGIHTNHLLAYDLKALNEPPRVSPVEVAWAEWFEYNPFDQEIYVYNWQTGALLILDATTLALKKSVVGLNLSAGDVSIVLDRHTDSIVIMAEDVWPSREPSPTDDGIKTPIVVVDRATGKLLHRVRWCEARCNPGTGLIHPRKPVLYLGFTDMVLAYDTRARKVVARTTAGDRWMDGVALTPEGDELLVAAPAYSAVLRFDAETLEYKGRITAAFGVRTLAVDVDRKLLLTGSLLTNMVEVIDLNTYARIARYWVAPWLRVIQVDTSSGAAFVSSTEGLFRVDYLARVPR